MKNIIKYASILLLSLFTGTSANGQSGTSVIIGGNGTTGIPNTSGSALLSPMYPSTQKLTSDNRGNVYFAAQAENYSLSKIDRYGNISFVAGDSVYDDPSMSVWGYYNQLFDMTCDKYGNLYYVDAMSENINKIDTNGIASIVSTGSLLFTGDAMSVFIDKNDNIFFGTTNHIYKRTPAGIISNCAGTGARSYNGDNIPANAADITGASSLTGDNNGNIYFVDQFNYRLRKIDNAGIITTVAGNGSTITGIVPDDIMSTSSPIDYYSTVTIDTFGMIYIEGKKISPLGKMSTASFITYPTTSADAHGNFYSQVGAYLKKIMPAAPTRNFNLEVNRMCAGAELAIETEWNDSTLKMITNFGDGYLDTTLLRHSMYSGGYCAVITHPYPAAGSYTIKNVIYRGATPVDSFINSYTYSSCGVIHLRPFIDANSDCVFNTSTEIANVLPLTIAVDSNGVAKDTFSITSGLYYNAYGSAGDIYTFRIIGHAAGITSTCPASGIIADTFTLAGDNSGTIDIGLNCSSLPGTDLTINSGSTATRRTQHITIGAINSYCLPTAATVVVNISPKYNYQSAYPLPTSVSGHTLTWNLSPLSSISSPTVIQLQLEVPGAWLLPGDTAHTSIKIISGGGDVDTSNNTIIRVDTVRSSFDPNYMAVDPQGNILNGTKLKYTIEFENDGNDTAQNIYVMDTLSDNVDPSSFAMVMTTNTMNIVKFTSGGHTIVKFDFPNIKLLDSSQHNQCTGMLMYTINAKRGLPDNTNIFGHAGIFFDDNPVVRTNTIQNVVRIPSISIAADASVCHGDTLRITATSPNINNTHYRWSVNSIAAGSDQPQFTSATLTAGDDVRCILWDSKGDSLLSTSNNISTSFLPLPDAGTITGTPAVCATSTTTLSNTITGGTWASSTLSATVTSGVVSGVAGGNSVISYSVTNSCGTAIDTMLVTVMPLPNAGSIIGPLSVCAGISTTVASTTTGGIWSSDASGFATVTPTGAVWGIAAGNTLLSYIVTNSCGSDTTAAIVTVNPNPTVGIIAGPDSVCVGSTIALTDAVSGGIWSSLDPSIATINVAGVLTALSSGTVVIHYVNSSDCGAALTAHSVTVLSVADCNTAVTSTITETATMGIYPNPNNGSFTLLGTWPTASGNEVTAEIMNMLGQVVYKTTFNNTNGIINEQVQVSNTLARGTYVLMLHSNGERRVFHFVVKE